MMDGWWVERWGRGKVMWGKVFGGKFGIRDENLKFDFVLFLDEKNERFLFSLFLSFSSLSPSLF